MKKMKKLSISLVISGVFLTFFLFFLFKSNSRSLPLIFSPTPTISIGSRTKISGCVAIKNLPDKACTPGSVIPSVTEKQVCVPGYAKSARNVSEREKNEVFTEYGIFSHQSGEYEIDHLISLELGGSNDIANLWPEVANPTPGFHEKDQVENYIHKQVCSGVITLEQAQKDISNNWLVIYEDMPRK